MSGTKIFQWISKY